MLSPIDARYYNLVKELEKYFSEDAYYFQRIKVELHHFVNIAKILDYNYDINTFREITKKDIDRIKEIEKTTNHDVKAIEYFLREYLRENIKDFNKDNLIHFGLTSQDINSVAFSYNFKQASNYIVILIDELIDNLKLLSSKCININMLGRTHGQPAISIKMEDMIKYYIYRIIKQNNRLKEDCNNITAKFGGAVGNHSALKFVMPDENWEKYSSKFVNSFGLIKSLYTTQIDSYDSYCNLLNDLKLFSVILKDLLLNIWNYIKDEYFIQECVVNEVGSSTMPQKINPIDIENSFGQIEMFISNIEGVSRSLPYSLYQRDIKDSSILRNFGEIYGKIVIAIKKSIKGISKLSPNKKKIKEDLDNHPEICLEKIQTYLRFIGINDAYELVKNVSRGSKLDKIKIKNFIENLDISHKDKIKLINII